jgi:hypothetical protein
VKIFYALVLTLLFPVWAHGQVAVQLAPDARQQFLGANGVPLAGGKLCTYAAGTTTPQPTYTDSTGLIQNSNPIILDGGGFATIWIANLSYKFILLSAGTDSTCATGTQQWMVDNIQGPAGILVGNYAAEFSTITDTGLASTSSTLVCATITGVLSITGCPSNLPSNNVLSSGALCNGVNDDTLAISTLYTSFTSANQAEIDWPPNQTCVLSGTITLINAQSVRINGGHVSWKGSASTPIFNYINDRNVTTQGFYVTTTAPGSFPMGTVFAIQENTVAGQGISSADIFTGNVIEGVSAGGLNIGFEMVEGTAGEANNDSMRFYGNEVRNYTTAAFKVDSVQSSGHDFYGNQCYGNGIGAACVNNEDTTDLVGQGGTFKWFGGLAIQDTSADFIIGTNSSQPDVIEGITSEDSNRFITASPAGPITAAFPIQLIGDDFATNDLNADGHIVTYNAPGPLTVIGGNYGRATPIGNFYFNGSGGAGCACAFGTIEGVSFSATNANGSLPVAFGGGITNYVLLLNNTYANATQDNATLPTAQELASFEGKVIGTQILANNGAACTNAELALSAGWGSTASVTGVIGTGQTCQWLVTSNGTGVAGNPTITDTLTNPLPTSSTVCDMSVRGGSTTSTPPVLETVFSATAPVFIFAFTPAGSGATYYVERRCGP